MSLSTSVLQGDRLALARLLSKIENDTPEGRAALNDLFPKTGNAHLVGVTGAPGTGKSSLVNQLALHYRQSRNGDPKRVAIVAVDPSSPFTGGAIMGDRVRMRDLFGDPGVFIRSMASRGSLGGLAATTSGVVQALDAAGFERILIETVGAGQAEVDIARLAHTTLVVEAPGLGDDIQAIKAGILEIADVLVVNKADRLGVEITERALLSMLRLGHPAPHVFHDQLPGKQSHLDKKVQEPEESDDGNHLWIPPILRTIATDGQGVPELAQAINEHYEYLKRSGEKEGRERARLQSELDLILRATLVHRWRVSLTDGLYEEALQRLFAREISPRQAVDILLDEEPL
jgi:LAO/AO transport system kinase